MAVSEESRGDSQLEKASLILDLKDKAERAEANAEALQLEIISLRQQNCKLARELSHLDANLQQAEDKINMLEDIIEEKAVQNKQLYQLAILSQNCCPIPQEAEEDHPTTNLYEDGLKTGIELLQGQMAESFERLKQELLDKLVGGHSEIDKRRIRQLEQALQGQRERKCETQVSMGQLAEMAIAKLKAHVGRLEGEKQKLLEDSRGQEKVIRDLRKKLQIRNTSMRQLFEEMRVQSSEGWTDQQEEKKENRESGRSKVQMKKVLKESYQNIMNKRSPTHRA